MLAFQSLKRARDDESDSDEERYMAVCVYLAKKKQQAIDKYNRSPAHGHSQAFGMHTQTTHHQRI